MFLSCYNREQTSWAESVCGKAKQNYHLGAAAERLIKTKGMPVRFRYQPAKRTKRCFVEFAVEPRESLLVPCQGTRFLFLQMKEYVAMSIKVNLKGDSKEFESGVSVAEIAKSIGAGLYKAACAGKVDGEVVDLRTPLTKDCNLEILTFSEEEGKKAYWHTAAHVLAQAVKRLFPDAKLAIGPAIDNGFYYDIDLSRPLSQEDLPKIEAEMKKIIKENLPIERFELAPNEAKTLMQEQDQIYKVELIEEHADKGEAISFYKQGEFTRPLRRSSLDGNRQLKSSKTYQCNRSVLERRFQ